MFISTGRAACARACRAQTAIHVRTDNGKVAFKCSDVDLYRCARMDVVSSPVLRGGGSEAGRRRHGPRPTRARSTPPLSVDYLFSCCRNVDVLCRQHVSSKRQSAHTSNGGVLADKLLYYKSLMNTNQSMKTRLARAERDPSCASTVNTADLETRRSRTGACLFVPSRLRLMLSTSYTCQNPSCCRPV
jgi:hypothetical protein